MKERNVIDVSEYKLAVFFVVENNFPLKNICMKFQSNQLIVSFTVDLNSFNVIKDQINPIFTKNSIFYAIFRFLMSAVIFFFFWLMDLRACWTVESAICTSLITIFTCSSSLLFTLLRANLLITNKQINDKMLSHYAKRAAFLCVKRTLKYFFFAIHENVSIFLNKNVQKILHHHHHHKTVI